MFWMCICILSLVIRHANLIFSAPHYIPICGLPRPTIFFHIMSRRHAFRKAFIENVMRVLMFSKTFVWNISHPKKNWARWYCICTSVAMLSTCYSWKTLMKLEFSRHIFEKSSNVTFHNIRPVEAELFHANGHDKANSRFSQLLMRLIKHSANNTDCSFII